MLVRGSAGVLLSLELLGQNGVLIIRQIDRPVQDRCIYVLACSLGSGCRYARLWVYVLETGFVLVACFFYLSPNTLYLFILRENTLYLLLYIVFMVIQERSGGVSSHRWRPDSN